jgi:hypothetical protein
MVEVSGTTETIAGIAVPDSAMCKQATALVKEAESDLLYHHSRRVFFFGALVGVSKNLKFDAELLYIGAMFHDMGLLPKYATKQERFEVDSANAAADFLRQHKIADEEIEMVWDAVALHTTPGIPQHKKPVVALVTAGVEMDVLGLGFDAVSNQSREAVAAAHPRGPEFKEGIMRAFYDGNKDKPQTTFGNVNADVLAKFDPKFRTLNFCEIISNNQWPS